MLKYITLMILILAGILFFMNKDNLLSRYSENNTAAVSNAAVVIVPGGNHYILTLQRIVGDRNGMYPVGSGTLDTTTGSVYAEGSTVIITATPDKKSKVVWSSSCSGSKNVCQVKMDSNKDVYYAFVKKSSFKDLFKTCKLGLDPLSKEVTLDCAW